MRKPPLFRVSATTSIFVLLPLLSLLAVSAPAAAHGSSRCTIGDPDGIPPTVLTGPRTCSFVCGSHVSSEGTFSYNLDGKFVRISASCGGQGGSCQLVGLNLGQNCGGQTPWGPLSHTAGTCRVEPAGFPGGLNVGILYAAQCGG